MTNTTVQTNVATTNSYATSNNNNNAFGLPTSPTMANDFFGSQAFSDNFAVQYPPNSQESTNVFTTPSEPQNNASAILQTYMNESTTSQNQQYSHNQINNNSKVNYTPATLQDYMTATQIANQFANANNYLISPYDAYHQRDFLAQNNLAIYNRNSQILQQPNLSYLS